MIAKIKELMETKEHIDIIKNNLNYTSSSVSELKKEITSLKEQLKEHIDEVSHKSDEFFRNFEENMDIIKNVRHDFEKEFFQFKLLKAQMQKKLIEKFEEELDKELKINTEKLREDADKYNELKENISEITKKISNLGQEIDKFVGISRNIKKEDFEMTKFAHQLLAMDKEKIELIRKVDTMERLVSKMRRQEYITR